MMIAPERFKVGSLRSGVFFGWGVCLALTGSSLVVMYFFLVTHSPVQTLGETLMWAVPAGLVCWIFAVGLFAAGFVAWNSEGTGAPNLSKARRELVRETAPANRIPFHAVLTRAKFAVQKRLPAAFPMEWSLPLLRSLNKRVFKKLGSRYFGTIGFRSIAAVESGTGGVDIWLYGEEELHAVGAVQCLPWGRDSIGLRQVREFHYLMAIEQIENGVILTTGEFTEEALSFALGKKLELISGDDFLAKLTSLPVETAEQLLREAAKGD